MTSLQLRETERASQWLKQFDTDDVHGALSLIDELRLVSSADFVRGMFSVLTRTSNTLLKDRLGERTVAFFTARERPRNISTPYFSLEDPSIPPSATAPGGDVGSEAEVAHLLRDFCHSDPDHLFSHPSLTRLRATRTKNYVFVDDLIGSGTRITRMLDWFYQHPTIKSWRSGGRVKFHVIAYAGTSVGISSVRAHRLIDSVSVLHPLAYGSRCWSVEKGSRIEGVCRQYAGRHLGGRYPLGFQGAFTNIVFEHTCPNTNPAILYRKSRNWTPLFDKRPVAGMSVWPVPRDLEAQRRELLEATGRTRLAHAIENELLGESDILMLLALTLAPRHRGRAEVLAEWINLSATQSAELIQRCQKFGWLSSAHYLTDQGRAILQQARGLKKENFKDIPLKTGTYIPHTLR